MVTSFPPLEAPVKHVYEGCILGKMQRAKFPKDGSVRATCRLQLACIIMMFVGPCKLYPGQLSLLRDFH